MLYGVNKALDLVLRLVYDKMLAAMWVENFSMACHEGHHATGGDALRAESGVQVECVGQIVRKSQYCLSKSILANLRAETNSIDQHSWGQPVRIFTRYGEVAPPY